MHQDVHSFISYYIDILEDQLVQNDELNEKGVALYKNHKEAVELLSAVGKGKVEKGNDFATELIHIYSQYKETIDFVVKVGNSFLREAFIRFAQELEWPEHLHMPHFRVPNFIEPTWEDVDSLVESMQRLYRKDFFQSLLRLSNEAVKMGDDDSSLLVEPPELKVYSPLEKAFALFVNERRISSDYYNVNHIVPSFVEPEWTELPSEYKVTE